VVENVCLGMDFEQFRPCVVLDFLNVKGNFDEVCDVRNSERMMNGRVCGLDSRFGC